METLIERNTNERIADYHWGHKAYMDELLKETQKQNQ